MNESLQKIRARLTALGQSSRAFYNANRVMVLGGITIMSLLLIVWARLGFTLEVSQFFAAESDGTVTVYRASNAAINDRILTADPNQYNTLGAQGWTQNGAAFQAFSAPGTYQGASVVPLYSLYNDTLKKHLYSTDTNENTTLPQSGWIAEGAIAYVFPTSVAGALPLYRLSTSTASVATADENEKNTLVAQGWTNNGIMGYIIPIVSVATPTAPPTTAPTPAPTVESTAPPVPVSAPVDISRLYLESIKDHVLTADPNQYNTLGAQGWTQEGVAFQAFSSAGAYQGVSVVPLYALYNDTLKQHLYSTDANENATLPTQGWLAQGVVTYVLPTQVAGTVPLYRLYVTSVHYLTTADDNEKNTRVSEGWINQGIMGYVLPSPVVVTLAPTIVPTPTTTAVTTPTPITTATVTPTPTTTPSLFTCDPATQEADVGQVVQMIATGGVGVVSWTSNPSGNPTTYTGPTARITFPAPGTYQVTATDQLQPTPRTTVCTVIVSSGVLTPTPTNIADFGIAVGGRNVSTASVESGTVSALGGQQVEVIANITNIGNSILGHAIVQAPLSNGLVYVTGSTSVNGSPTTVDSITAGGLALDGLGPNQTAVVRFRVRITGSVFPVGQSSVLLIVHATSEGVPAHSAQLTIVVNRPTGQVGTVKTGPGEAVGMALLVSAVMTLLYVSYTHTSVFRRREVDVITQSRDPMDFRS